jgi:hypothetical protein
MTTRQTLIRYEVTCLDRVPPKSTARLGSLRGRGGASVLERIVYQNNLRRIDDELSSMESGIMAAITMCGTSPIFYKIPITQDLVDCVKMGMEPNTETKVLRHVPFYPDGCDKGMVPLGNRLLALKCYNAFKAIVFRDHTV